jgi:hypothetical protein
MYLFTNTNVRKIGESVRRSQPLQTSAPSAPAVVRSTARHGSIRGRALVSLLGRAGALLVVLISGGQRCGYAPCTQLCSARVILRVCQAL